jgi:hypothetical protein
MRILISACLASCALYGQAGRLQAPSAGFVFDGASHSLRRIQGIPGAALIGDSIDFGFPVTAATVSPRMDSAIVLAADGAPHIFRLASDGLAEVSIAGLATPERLAFSPSGTAAALYAAGNIQVIRGLPDTATLAATIRVHGNTKARGPALAVSDDGAYLLFTSSGPVELIGVAGDSRKLLDAAPGALVAFAPGGHDAAVTHAGTLTIYRDLIGPATQRDVAGISSPSALAFSSDGHIVFVASEHGRTVSAIDAAAGGIVPLNCDCAPAALVPMGALFRLNEMSDAPLWLLDASATPKLIFVPAKSSI